LQGRCFVCKKRCRDATNRSRLDDDDSALTLSRTCCAARAEEIKGEESGLDSVDHGMADAVGSQDGKTDVELVVRVVDSNKVDRDLIFSITSCVDLAGELGGGCGGRAGDAEKDVLGAVLSNGPNVEKGVVVDVRVNSTLVGSVVDTIDAHRALSFSTTSCVDETGDAEPGAFDAVFSNNDVSTDVAFVASAVGDFGECVLSQNDERPIPEFICGVSTKRDIIRDDKGG
jgi:hypothetical protein